MKEILYIPGLGNEKVVRAQRIWVKAISLFRSKKIHFFDPHWEVEGGEPDEVRYGRLLEAYEAAGSPSDVWGASAGGSLAMRIGIAKGLDVTLVCAKAQGADKIGLEYDERAPNFRDSVKASEQAIASKEYRPENVVSFVPKGRDTDGVVEVSDMIPEGATVRYLDKKRLNHSGLIAYALVRHLPVA